MKTDYEIQADNFLTETNTELTISFLKNGKHFADDKENRDIYECTLKRGQRMYTFNFGNSLNNSGFCIINKAGKELKRFNVPDKDRDLCIKKGFVFNINTRLLPFPMATNERIKKPITPNSYDILACLTKYDPGTFENFCNEFGYDTDSKKAEKTYTAVKDEYLHLSTLYSESELEKMAEIQ